MKVNTKLLEKAASKQLMRLGPRPQVDNIAPSNLCRAAWKDRDKQAERLVAWLRDREEVVKTRTRLMAYGGALSFWWPIYGRR